RQPRLRAFGDPLRTLLEIDRRLKDEAPLLQDLFSRGRKPGPVAISLEQRKAEILLELLHCVGDSRRYPKQLFCGGGKAAAALNRVDDLEPFEGDSHLVHGRPPGAT